MPVERQFANYKAASKTIARGEAAQLLKGSACSLKIEGPPA
jgi:hypothetical protein